MSSLREDKRAQLMAKGQSGEKEKDGQTRYQKRVKSKIASSNKEFNQIDMNKLFRDDILTVNIPVVGETNNYLVTFSFSGFLEKLHSEIETNGNALALKTVLRAIVNSFNTDDVYIRCNCEDFRYRFSYWGTRNNTITGEKELRPSDITNPDDRLGSGCKHIMLCLSNTGWCIKVAAVVKNYIEYMEKHLHSMYAKVIYPAIWQKPYEDPVQMSMFDDDDLLTDKDTIDRANVAARQKGRWEQGNQYRFTKQSDDKDQMKMTFDKTPEEEEDDQQ